MIELDTGILVPAAVLVIWTMLILGWMFRDRMIAFKAHKVDVGKAQPGARGHELASVLPPGSDWPAHNYMHLMEQPTVFYPAVVLLALGGYSGYDVALAWLYVVLRIVHSVWQIRVNTVPMRAAIFTVASVVLFILAIRALLAVIS